MLLSALLLMPTYSSFYMVPTARDLSDWTQLPKPRGYWGDYVTLAKAERETNIPAPTVSLLKCQRQGSREQFQRSHQCVNTEKQFQEQKKWTQLRPENKLESCQELPSKNPRMAPLLPSPTTHLCPPAPVQAACCHRGWEAATEASFKLLMWKAQSQGRV